MINFQDFILNDYPRFLSVFFTYEAEISPDIFVTN